MDRRGNQLYITQVRNGRSYMMWVYMCPHSVFQVDIPEVYTKMR